MADRTTIEWCRGSDGRQGATWNIITGCSVVSPGCTNCYAMRLAGTRLRRHPSRRGLTQDSKAGPVWTGEARFNYQWLGQPLEWREPRMIFVAAHGDLFHHRVSDHVLDTVFTVMETARQHTYQVLTKRAARMRAYVNQRYAGREPPPHIWFGVSCEDQPRLDERLIELMGTNAAVRFLSLEPLLGPIKLNAPLVTLGLPMSAGARLHWAIVGGESGPGARPMRLAWVRSIRDQCYALGIAFFFKQWGAWLPGEVYAEGGRGGLSRHIDGQAWPRKRSHWWAGDYWGGEISTLVGKKAAGRRLDGVEHNAMPEVAA